jgi:ABC-type Fe3+/spermidine/putrescine transport system ATPase subunit
MTLAPDLDVTAATAETAAVSVRGLTKRYGPVRALDGVDLDIEAGSYFVLLGPSGGGKTTLLRALGGFIRPDAGTVALAGREVQDLPPNRRPTGMVFQSYALFPHMSVLGNVAYGLKLRRLSAEEARARAEAVLARVGLEGYGERRVWELSGGQQQRVQLARALALEPRILLLDEPLAALDAKLRKEMCYELKHLQEQVGITFVHVTHNQEEAMTVADRIALISDGRLVEAGAPREIYERPRRRFTAEFVGERNLFDGPLASIEGGVARLATPGGEALAALPPEAGAARPGARATISVRSERTTLTAEPVPGRAALRATWRERVYLGLVAQHIAALPDGRELSVRMPVEAEPEGDRRPGDPCWIGWDPADARLHLD